MSSVGVFLEKEINGKPYHIFSFLSETDNPSYSFSPSLFGEEATGFFCPNLRHRVALLKHEEYSNDDDDKDEDNIVPVSTSPRFKQETVSQQVQFVLDMVSLGTRIIRPTICYQPVRPIFWWDNEEPNDVDSLKCGACELPEVGSDDYLCDTCNQVFHKECVEAPLFIKHPSYTSLSLQFYSPSSGVTVKQICIFCETQIDGLMAYYCPTYNVVSHVVCAMKPIPIIIDHFKRHPHTLTFFPKQASLACDVCGMIKELIPTYICARCVFVVHQDCIYFPYVIRICRHHHRISFTYSLPSGKLSCGVCRRKVDNSCGAYSCNKCDGYFVHSRCALRRDLWDGEELEGTPEEIEIVEDPFKTIADGIILHFCHGHHLKLEICRDYDEDKYCQACVLPIYEGDYYSCVDDQCDFILHETCASAPCKIRHPLHAHPLTLKVATDEYSNLNGFFSCDACQRNSNGFVYEDSTAAFRLDVRCASVSEPFKYEGHEHPLFLALTPDEEKGATCHICHDSQ